MSEAINRKHKDRLFCFIFGREENKRWTLSLYNAVNETDYTDPEAVDITTMDDIIYMGMKNDVSFLINSELSLYEQQSTYNPNMPVRQLMYLGRQYDKYIKQTKQNMYGSKLMTLPVPRLVTFYNGIEDIPDEVLHLSDSFNKCARSAESDVEVTVHLYNIRLKSQNGLVRKCSPLAEYSWFIEEIRNNQKSMELEQAVGKAIRDMPDDYAIKDFLAGHKSEVTSMCITEYNEAETMQMFKEEGREEGRKEGRDEGRDETLITQICKKLVKGKPVHVIADEVEESEEYVSKICDIAGKYLPNYDVQKIMAEL